MQFTNTAKGPRGLNTASGPVLVEPGQTVDVEISSAELKVAMATGWFDVSGKEPAHDDEGEDGLDREDLKKQADELNIQYAPNVKTAKLKELIDAKLAQ